MKKLILLVAVFGVVLAGCGSAAPDVTKDQEKAYRNPPKEMPAAASDSMKKGMEEAKKKQADNQNNAPAGN